MYNITQIQENYKGLVGFMTSANPDIVPINEDSTLLTSYSGLYETNIAGIDYTLFEAILISDYQTYEEYLTAVYNNTVLELIAKFWNNYKEKHGAKELLINKVLHNSVSCYNDKKLIDGKAIGFKLSPFRSNNIRIEITKFSIHSATDATFVVYFYNTTQKTPIKTKTVTVTANTAVSVDITDAIVYCQNNGIGTGELMVVVYGYDSNDVHINKQLPENSYTYSQLLDENNKYITVKPITFDYTAFNYDNATQVYNLPDMSKIAYCSETHGLNIRIIANCDYTQLLIDNRLLFAPLLQRAIAIKLFTDGFMTSNFNNITESKRETWRQMILKLEAELYGYTDEKMAVVAGYFQQVALDLSNLDNICLPCRDEAPRVIRIGY